MSKIQFYGIRHHGPGSARRLQTALEEWKPDLVLIELPADAQPLLDAFNPGEMHPPVSILVYDPGNFNKAAYFPMATFSPEWQALNYGYHNLIPCHAIDLPMGHYFQQDFSTERWSKNPFTELAYQTGFQDVEQWWDHYLENNQSTTELFQALEQLMEVLRTDLPDSEENASRETYMKSLIGKYTKDGYERIAVVCGAFHVPGLRDFDQAFKKKTVKSKSSKTEAIWIPWSYERLTQKNAYGAGVLHPTWYEALYHFGNDAAQYWLAKAITILRDKGLYVSSAHTVEALRLTEALRRLRKKNKIGIPELEHSLTATVFDGEPDWLSLYGNDLYVGAEKGRIPKDLYQIPLQKDFRNRIKKARLSKVLEEHKKIQKTLDLRKDLHRSHSRFFNQVRVLEIPLARPQESETKSLGTFKENWDIEWDPVSEWTIVQAGTYGTTVAAAAKNKLEKSIHQAEEMEILVEGLRQSFLCGFTGLFDLIRERMILMYAVSDSIISLLDSLATLLFVDQYGHIRWETTPHLRPLMERIAHRSADMLPGVIPGLDEETDDQLRHHLIQIQYALAHPVYASIREMFNTAWVQILQQNNKTDYYHGVALRKCMEGEFIEQRFIEEQFIRHFSDPYPGNVLDWLDGLLSGNILWMVYDEPFRHRLNSWIDQMDKNTFTNNLPVLRKLFTQSGLQERQKLFHTILQPDDTGTTDMRITVPEVIEKYVAELTEQYFYS